MTTPLFDQFPEGRLPKEEEAALAKKAQHGNQAAANKLVLSAMREALLYTKRVTRGTIDDAERASLCYERLMMCVQRFDPSRGVRFFAFSKAALRGKMKRFWETQDAVRNAKEVISVDVLSGWLKQGQTQWRNVSTPHDPAHLARRPIEKEDDHEDSIRERITGEVDQPEMDQICIRDRWASVEKLIRGKLTPRQRMVLVMTYKSGLSFPEIGKLLGFTRSMIHVIHREAIQKIRDEIARDGRLLIE